MPINPAYTTGGRSLFGGDTGFLQGLFGGGKGIGMAGAAAGGIAGMPWAIIIPIAMSLIGEIFKESPEQKAQEMQGILGNLGMEPPFQNPYLPQMSEAAMRAVLGQLQQTSGWGWPADRQPPNTDWIQDMLTSLPTGTGGTRIRRRIQA